MLMFLQAWCKCPNFGVRDAALSYKMAPNKKKISAVSLSLAHCDHFSIIQNHNCKKWTLLIQHSAQILRKQGGDEFLKVKLNKYMNIGGPQRVAGDPGDKRCPSLSTRWNPNSPALSHRADLGPDHNTDALCPGFHVCLKITFQLAVDVAQ